MNFAILILASVVAVDEPDFSHEYLYVRNVNNCRISRDPQFYQYKLFSNDNYWDNLSLVIRVDSIPKDGQFGELEIAVRQDILDYRLYSEFYTTEDIKVTKLKGVWYKITLSCDEKNQYIVLYFRKKSP